MALLFKAVSWHAAFRSKCLMSFSCLTCMLKSRKISWNEKPPFSDTHNIFLFFLWRFDPIPVHGCHLRGFTITLRHATLHRSALDEWSARRRDLHLTKRDTHERQTSMSPARFEPTIPESERPQTHALYRSATGIATHSICAYIIHTLKDDLSYGNYIIYGGIITKYWIGKNARYSSFR